MANESSEVASHPKDIQEQYNDLVSSYHTYGRAIAEMTGDRLARDSLREELVTKYEGFMKTAPESFRFQPDVNDGLRSIAHYLLNQDIR